MADVDALFRLLNDAPPRAAEIVKRVALRGLPLAELGALYGVDEARAEVLLFRALLDVRSGGTARVSDAREPAELAAMRAGPAGAGEGSQARALLDRLTAHRVELTARLQHEAEAFARSPDRVRDERLRWVAIVVVLALTAYFYWREQHQPTVLLPRPTSAPQQAP